jgi:glycosyltransferase involved in cell wall biosynthesis
MTRRSIARRPLYVNGRFLGQPRAGVQRYATELLRQWDRMLEQGELEAGRDEIVVLTPPGQAAASPFKNINIKAVGNLHGNSWEQIELPQFSADHILFNPCNSAPWLNRGALTVTIHDASVFAVPYAYNFLYRLKHRLLYRRFATTARTILTVSEFSKEELIRRCNMPADRIRVIYSGCEHILDQPADLDILRREGLGERPYILAVGGHSVHKNVAAVLQAAEHLRDQNLDFVIAGGVPSRVFQAVHYEVPAHVRWIGSMTDPELRALYEGAALLIFPSLYEGFGFPVLEAMACGCPVVLSSAASLPELGGSAAQYFDPLDIPGLVSSVQAVLTDANLRARMVAAGREQARRFNWEQSARQTWDALREPA